MADDLLMSSTQVPIWIIAVVFLGSVVDLFQFVWIVKRGYRKLKRQIYRKIKEELENEQKG